MTKLFLCIFIALLSASTLLGQVVFHIYSTFLKTIEDYSLNNCKNGSSSELEHIINYGPQLHIRGRIENNYCEDIVLSAWGKEDYIKISYKVTVTIDSLLFELPYSPSDYLVYYFPSIKGTLYGEPIEYSIIKQGEIVEGAYIDTYFLGNSVFSRLIKRGSNMNDSEVRKYNIVENWRLAEMAKRLLPSLCIEIIIQDPSACSKQILYENGYLEWYKN